MKKSILLLSLFLACSNSSTGDYESTIYTHEDFPPLINFINCPSNMIETSDQFFELTFGVQKGSGEIIKLQLISNIIDEYGAVVTEDMEIDPETLIYDEGEITAYQSIPIDNSAFSSTEIKYYFEVIITSKQSDETVDLVGLEDNLVVEKDGCVFTYSP